MKSTQISLALFLTCLFAAPASSLSPPPDFVVQPFSASFSPIVLTKGTSYLHLSIRTEAELDDLAFVVLMHEGELELGEAEVEFLNVDSNRGTLKIAVEELEVGTYRLELVPSFQVSDFDPNVHLQIVEAESSVSVGEADLGTNTRESGQRTCCEISQEGNDCFSGETCQRCWSETRLMERRLSLPLAIEGVQVSVEALLDGEPQQALEFYEVSEVSFTFPQEDVGPYCVELIVRDLEGTILLQTEEECFQSADFPELDEPVAIEPPNDCLGEPMTPIEPVDPGTGPSTSDKDESSSCSTAAGGPGALLLLALFGLLRRRHS